MMKAIAGLILTAAAAFAAPVWAQGTAPFPSRNVVIVVPLPPGGPTDMMARMVQPRLASLLGQNVIVENRVGAGGYVGLDYVATAPADGHTLAMHAFGGMHSHLFTKGNRNLALELAPVAMFGETPNVAIISTSVPARTLREFIDYAKANKGKLNVAIVPNTAIALETFIFLKALDVDLVSVPYNGSAPIYQALARGDAHFFMATVGGSKASFDAGHARPLAVPAGKRASQLPDVPTARELGFNIEASQVFAMMASAKTPPAVMRTLNEKVAFVINLPENRERLEKLGYIVDPGQPEALAARLARESETLERAAREAKIVPQ